MAAKKPSIDQFIRRPSQQDWDTFKHFWAVLKDNTVRQEVATIVFRDLYDDEAHARLQEFVDDGRLEVRCARALEVALGLEPVEWEHRLARHTEDFAAFERSCESWRQTPETELFHPYILLKHDPDKRKRRLFVLAQANVTAMRRIMVDPDLPRAPRLLQIAAVRALIAANGYTELGARARDMLGEPRYFAYRRALRETWEFSPDGRLLEEHGGYNWESGVRLEGLAALVPPAAGAVVAKLPAVQRAVEAATADQASSDPPEEWEEILTECDDSFGGGLAAWAGLSDMWHDTGLGEICNFLTDVAADCPWISIDQESWEGGPGSCGCAYIISTCDAKAARKDLRKRLRALRDENADYVRQYRKENRG